MLLSPQIVAAQVVDSHVHLFSPQNFGKEAVTAADILPMLGDERRGPTFSGIYSQLKAFRNLREDNIGYDSAINSTPSVAKTMSSLEERPLTATAPTTSPFFHTGMPPPHPTYLGSP